MGRVNSLSEQGKTIVFTDLSGLAPEESPPVMDEAVSVISGYDPKSVFSLVDMSNIRFNKVVIAKVTDIAKQNEPFVIATAIVGLNSVTKLIAKSVIKLTGRNTELFNSVDEAKEWILGLPD